MAWPDTARHGSAGHGLDADQHGYASAKGIKVLAGTRPPSNMNAIDQIRSTQNHRVALVETLPLRVEKLDKQAVAPSPEPSQPSEEVPAKPVGFT
jgi:hypothetical protein